LDVRGSKRALEKLHNELHNLQFSSKDNGQIMENNRGGVCSTHWSEDKCIMVA
jgi:hypothetical protein